MTPQNRIRDLRQNGILISMNAGKSGSPASSFFKRFVRSSSLTVRRRLPAVSRQLPQFAERCGFRGHRGPLIRYAPPLYATAQVACRTHRGSVGVSVCPAARCLPQ